MKRYGVTVLFIVFVLVSSSDVAMAQFGGGWTWLDKLSGPGDFWGPAFYMSFCLGSGGETVRIKECDFDNPRIWFNLGGGRATTDAGTREDLDYPAMSLWTFEPSLDIRLFKIDWFSFEWGFATGLHRFKSDGFQDFWRVSLQPIRFGVKMNIKSYSQIVVRISGTYFIDGFTAADFGDLNGTFVSRGELLATVFVSYKHSFF